MTTVVPEWFTTREVADMFCVSVPTVRSWRTPAYKDSPLRLVGERVGHNQYRYSLDALDAFVALNPRFHPLLAYTLRRGTPVFPVLPLALRDTPAADTTDTPIDQQTDFSWWVSHGATEQSQHPQHPQKENHP